MRSLQIICDSYVCNWPFHLFFFFSFPLLYITWTMKVPFYRHHARQSNQTNTTSADQPNTKAKKPKVSFIQLFRFATRAELCIILIAAILSAISGCLPPTAILIYGSYITKIVRAQGNQAVLASIMPTIHLMLVMGTAAIVTTYISTCLWIRMGERQVRRIRAIYLHSILNQDMSWFDTAKDDSLLTRLASDTQLIQDGISEKLGLCISFFCQFIAGYVVGFYKGILKMLIDYTNTDIRPSSSPPLPLFLKATRWHWPCLLCLHC